MATCTQLTTVRSNEVVPLSQPDTYTVSVASCLQGQCTNTVSQQVITVSNRIDAATNSNVSINSDASTNSVITTQGVSSILTKIDQLRQSVSANLQTVRGIFHQLYTLYGEEGNAQGQQVMTTLLALNDAALGYVISNFSELPVSDADSLAFLAQEATNVPADSSSAASDTTASEALSTSESDSPEVTAANALIGVAVGLGLVAGGIYAVSRIQYLKPGTAATSKHPQELVRDGTLAPVAGEVGSNVVKFDGVSYTLPEGMTVAAIGEASTKSVLDVNGNTRPLGAGSQGTAFSVEQKGKKLIIKFDNKLNASLRSARQATDISVPEIEASKAGFRIEDVGVASSLRETFGNGLEANLETTRVYIGGKSVEISGVVKTQIQGDTLKKLLENGTFFGEAGAVMRSDLQHQLFVKMSQPAPGPDGKPDLSGKSGYLVFEDLNPANLIWDKAGGQWVIIDAKPPITVKTAAEALRRNYASFVGKLSVTTRGRVFLRDKIRWFFSGVAKYAPVYSDAATKLTRDAELMAFLQETTPIIEGYTHEIAADPSSRNRILAEEVPRINSVIRGGIKVPVEAHIQDRVAVKETPIREKITTSHIAAGIGGFAALGAGIAAGVLSSFTLAGGAGASVQVQSLLQTLGFHQIDITTALTRIDGYTAMYMSMEKSMPQP